MIGKFAIRRWSLAAAVIAVGFTAAAEPHGSVVEPLKSVSELNALTMEGGHQAHSFELKGRIVAELAGMSAIFADESGSIHVRALTNGVLKAGTEVQLVGEAFYDFSRQLQCAVFEAKELGKFELPPPREIAVGRILGGQANNERVRVTGIIADVFRDDVDDDWNYGVLKSNGHSILFAIPGGARGREKVRAHLYSLCRFTGVVMADHCNMRRFIGPHIELQDAESIKTVMADRSSPFDAPQLENLRGRRPEEIAKTGLRTLVGRVAVVWDKGRRLVVIDRFGDVHNVELIDGAVPPACDSTVMIAGYPTTDLYLVNFSRAQVRRVEEDWSGITVTTNFVNQSMLFRDTHNRPIAPMAFHGWPVKMNGVVTGRDDRGRVLVSKKGWSVSYDIGEVPELEAVLAEGTKVEVTGICVNEITSWRPGAEFTTISGFFVAARRAADVKVLALPPWWTFARFMTVVGVLMGLLTAFIIWTVVLNRLVRRRSRELFRKDIDRVTAELRAEDRIRLAVELHDSVSQTLTGAALQLDAAILAEKQHEAERTRGHLHAARRVLGSCREELRNCLWDLRNHALDEREAAVAVDKTVRPHVGTAELTIDFAIPRADFSDQTFHEVLCILRELTVNAVRHGQAKTVKIMARRESERMTFAVSDDGCGFEPKLRPGVGEGHFGLTGIEERLRLLGGKLMIESATGKGTTIRFTIGRAKPQ